MSLKQRLVDLATDMGSMVKSVRLQINGNAADLSSLKTTQKAHLVGAINELVDSVGTKQAALGFAPENTNNKGQAGGYASLDGAGKVPAVQLPSYVDDVLEFPALANFPVQGETGKLYVATDTDRQYRWSGTAYRSIVASPGTTDAVPEGNVNKYFTDKRAQDALTTILGDVETDLVAVLRAAAA